MKKHCPHGSILPKGLKCDRGYLTIRVATDEGEYFKGCGAHTKDMEKIAILALNEIRKQQYLGVFNLPQQYKRMKFKEVAALYHKKHFELYRDPKTNRQRSHSSIRNNQSKINMLNEYFAEYIFDAIKTIDVKNYKEKRVNIDGVAGSTFNREKAVLSSIFSMVKEWVKGEEKDFPRVKFPDSNPCDDVPDLLEEKRTRLATLEELKRLKAACFELNDPTFWSIIYMELDTSARSSDLKKLHLAPVVDGKIQIEQGKTGRKLTLPALVKQKQAATFVNLRARWEAVRTRAGGMDDLQFRDLRKTGANLLQKLGYTTEIIKQSLGHASIKTTERHYLIEDAENIRPAIEAKRKLLDTI